MWSYSDIQQIRSSNIPDTVRYYKSGYPQCMPQTDFVRKFKCLGTAELSGEGFNIYDKVIDILDKQDMPTTAFKLGSSMVRMRLIFVL
jgi:myosin heavy subunit